MPNFYSKGNVRVEFRVVRAYITTDEVRNKTGTVANFSAKTILHNGKVQEVLSSHNSLRLTVSREGHLFVSSDYKQSQYSQNGRPTAGPKVFYFALLPGSNDGGQKEQRYDKFVGELAEEIQKFVIQARAAKEDKANQPREMPEAVAGLTALAPQAKTSNDNQDTGDIPF